MSKNKSTPLELPDLVTPEELERKFKILRSTQAALRSRRQIPFTLIGSRTPRYRKQEILDWLAERDMPVVD